MEQERQNFNVEKEGLAPLKKLLLEFHELSRRGVDETTLKPLMHRIVSVAQMLMPEDVNKQSEEAKREAYHLPESMYLSPAAFKKVEEERQKYSFVELQQDEAIPEGVELIDELKEMAVSHGRVILAIEGTKAIGVTLFQENEDHHYAVLFQYHDGQHIGAGLLMLDELMKKADDEHGSVSTFTRKTPLGLGNIGFRYEPKLGDLFNVYYSYESQEKIETEDPSAS